MTNPSRAKGTVWEQRIANYLRPWFKYADRTPLHGNKDIGDIGGVPCVIEAKNVKEIALAKWLDELDVEMKNANKAFGFVLMPRRKCGVAKGYAVMPIGQLPAILAMIEKETS